VREKGVLVDQKEELRWQPLQASDKVVRCQVGGAIGQLALCVLGSFLHGSELHVVVVVVLEELVKVSEQRTEIGGL
jgi:hypothetical protein